MANVKVSRKCPKCGGSAHMEASNGVDGKTYYCVCEKCGLRNRDHKLRFAAIASWNEDEEEYFFLQERLV